MRANPLIHDFDQAIQDVGTRLTIVLNCADCGGINESFFTTYTM